jgi:uncharacterized protein (DUF2147 family)
MRHDHQAPKSRNPWVLVGISGLFIAAAAGPAATAPNESPPAESGLWYNHSGKGAVEIRPCGHTGRDADRLCGFIVWLKDPNNRKGEPLTDGYNEDPRKRRRPICGLPVLGSLRPMSDGSWDQGWVYDPEQGKSFDAAIQLRKSDRLILTGYKGIKFFSKSFVWKRAPDNLPRCDDGLEREARASVGASPVAATVGAAAVGRPLPPLPDRAPQARASHARASQASGLVGPPPRPVPAVRPGAAAQ